MDNCWKQMLLESTSGSMHHLHTCMHTSSIILTARAGTPIILVHALLCPKVLGIGSNCCQAWKCCMSMERVSACCLQMEMLSMMHLAYHANRLCRPGMTHLSQLW